jgi:hypothetical protein
MGAMMGWVKIRINKNTMEYQLKGLHSRLGKKQNRVSELEQSRSHLNLRVERAAHISTPETLKIRSRSPLLVP